MKHLENSSHKPKVYKPIFLSKLLSKLLNHCCMCSTVYGYGSLAILIISLLSLFGILIYPCQSKSIYGFILSAMLGVAVGSLTGDAFLHLIPHVSLLTPQ
jgi:hypothetical protein